MIEPMTLSEHVSLRIRKELEAMDDAVWSGLEPPQYLRLIGERKGLLRAIEIVNDACRHLSTD